MEEMQVSDYWYIIKKNIFLIFIVFVLVFTTVMAYTYLSDPVYQGRTLVVVSGTDQTSVLLGNINVGTDMETQIAIVMSASVIGRVIETIPGLYEIEIANVKNSKIIEILAESTDPYTARDVANAVAENYVNYTLEQKRQEVTAVSELITGQITSLKNELDALNALLLQYETVDMTPEDEIEYRRLQKSTSTYEGRIDQSNLQLLELGNKEYITLNRADYLTKADYDDAVNRQDLQKAQDQITYQSLLDSIQGYTNEYEKLSYDLLQLEKKYKIQMDEIEYQGLLQNIQAKENLYNTLLKRREEVAIVEKEDSANIDIIEHALLPVLPIRPNILLNTLIGIILGISFSIGFAIIKEYSMNTFRDSDEIEKEFGPVLGQIPKANEYRRLSVNNRVSKYPFMTSKNKKFSEAIRMMRTSIKFIANDNNIRMFTFTSLKNGTGKSTLAMNLAHSLAQNGERVLLIDANLRNPVQNVLLGTHAKPGLIEVVLGQANLSQAIVKTREKLLDLLPAGVQKLSPGELFGSRSMQKFCSDTAKLSYNIIIFDTSSMLYSESSALAVDTDGTIVVMKHNHTSKDEAKKAKRALEKLNINICGAILNYSK